MKAEALAARGSADGLTVLLLFRAELRVGAPDAVQPVSALSAKSRSHITLP